MIQALRLFFILSSLLSFAATAQWAWVDKDGRKVFSDRAPEAGVPDKSIFKRPGHTVTLITQDAPANAAAGEPSAKTSMPAQASASSSKAAGIDKDLLERKKKEELKQAEQRKVEEDRVAKAKAENCQRAKQAKKGLDSGVRISRTNSQGEREILDDAARATEAKRVQSIVDSNCK